MPRHLNSSEELCRISKCAYCYLKQDNVTRKKYIGTIFQPCHFITPEKRYFNCIELGTVEEDGKMKRLIEIACERFTVALNDKDEEYHIRYGIRDHEARKHNMRIEAHFLRTYNVERHDLMIKKQRYDNISFGKGLFARQKIPIDTVLGYYPGDRISAQEMEKRSSSRFQGDRFVFSINSNEFVDGTGERKLIVFANDSPEKTANCVARFIETSYGTYGPFIVTKRDIAKNEELTYSYGNYPYEWRKKDTGCKRAVEESVPSQDIQVIISRKKKYHTGANHRFTPKVGNKIGEHLPAMEDRPKIAAVILKDLNLSENVSQAPRAARGCSKKWLQECCLCNQSFTSLVRHNCKGLAVDGGIKARRILKFCPLCPDFTALVEDLPRHIRKVHLLSRERSVEISSKYRSVVRQYKSGRLQKSGYWDVFSDHANEQHISETLESQTSETQESSRTVSDYQRSDGYNWHEASGSSFKADSDPDSDDNYEASDYFTALKHRRELQKDLAIAEAKLQARMESEDSSQ